MSELLKNGMKNNYGELEGLKPGYKLIDEEKDEKTKKGTRDAGDVSPMYNSSIASLDFTQVASQKNSKSTLSSAAKPPSKLITQHR